MRQICINNKLKPCTKDKEAVKRLVEGETYTTYPSGSKIMDIEGVLLKEIPTTNPDGFDPRRFIPISEKSEDEELSY